MAFKADTSGFKKGTDEMVGKLNEFNKALVDNQYKQRDSNKVISDAKKELKKLQEGIEANGSATEDEKKRIADLTDTIEQEKLKLSQLKTEQASIKNLISETTKELTENNKEWTVLKGTIANVASDALEKIGAKLLEIGKDVIETGEQFTTSMSEVQAISGATAGELEQLEDAARLYGATTVFSATEAADALKYMALAGWDAETSMAALPGVLDLAAASGMDLAAASDMVTDYLSAFGMEAEEASYMADLLTYAQGNSNTSTQQLGEAYRNCAANLSASGQDIETVTSLLEAMANQGLKGSQAGTALAAMMRDITDKMEEGKISIGNTSVSVQDAEGNFRDLTDILLDVEKAVDGMGTAEQAAALSNVFTANSIKGVNLVLNEGIGTISGYEDALRSSTGTAAEAASTMSDNLSGDLKQLESAMDELKLKIFEDAEGPLRDIVKTITTQGVPALEGLVKNIDKLIPVVVSAAAAMGSYKAAVAVQSIVKGAQQGIDDLKETIAKKTAATKAATAAEKLDTAEEQANKAAKQASTVEEQANTIAKNNNAVATKNGTTEEQLNAAATNTAKVAKDSEKTATEGATVAQEGLNKAIAANPVGLLVSALSILISVLSSAAIAIWGNAEEVSEHTKAMIEASNAADKYTGALKELEAKEGDIESEVAGETALLREQQAEYDELRNKVELTAEEKKRLATVAGQLAETLGLTTQDLKTQEGTYKDLSTEIDTYIDKMIQAGRAEYYADLIKESARTMESFKKPIEEAENNLNEFKEANKEVAAESLKIAKMQKTSPEGVYIEVSEEVQAYRDRLQELSAELAGYKTESRKAEMIMNDASEEYKNLAGATDDLGKKTTGTGTSTETLTNSVTDAASAAEVYKQKLKEAEKELISNTEAQKTQRDTVNKLRKEVDDMSKAVAGLTENEKGYTEQDLYEKQQEYLKAQEGLAELNTEETYLRDNIRSIKDAIKDTGDTGISYLDALSNAAKNLRGSLSDLAGSYEKLNGGQTLSYTTLLDLVDKYPEYATQLANAAGNADLQKAAIEALFNAKKQDYILTQQAAIDNIKASKKEAEETIKCIKAVIEAIGVKDGIFTTMYSSMLQNLINDVAGYDSELGTLQAKIDLMNGIDINSFGSSGGAVGSSPVSSGSSGTSGGPSGSDGRTKYTTTVGYSWKGESYNASYDFYEGDDTSTLDADARAKALLGVLDRAKSLGKVSTQEEIDFLNDLLSNADLGAMSEDQRYQIRQKLYAAQNGKSETEKLTKTYTSKWKGEEAQASYDYYEGQDTAAQDADTMAKSQLAVLDRAKALGKVTAQEEVDFLKKVLEIEGLSADQQYQIRVKLYQAENTLAAEQEKKREEAAQKAAEAEKKAAEELLERQKLALAAYNKLVEDKIDAYNKQAQAAKDAADAEIEALNKELAARKQAKEDENRQEKLDQINARLRYEQMDEFTRHELERAKQDLLNEIAEVNYERSIEKRKEEIRAEADAVSERSKEAIERLKASQEEFANRMAEMQGTQTYEQKVEHNSIAKNITIVQNGLNGNQLMNKILRELY